MKMKKDILVGFILAIGLSACTPELETEYGNSRIMFSNSAPSLALIDMNNTNDQLGSLPDSTINYVSVYRSGVTKNLDEIKVKISVDESYISNLISEASQTTAPTDEMKRYISSVDMPADMASIPSEVTIPKGARSALVPVILKMGKVKAYKNDILNYSWSDYNNLSVPKSKMLVLTLTITDTSKYEILEDKKHCFIEIIKCLTKL
jgi:hypothetical protein